MPGSAPGATSRWRRVRIALALLALIAASATVRVRTALADDAFRSGHEDGLLRSDPALLYYFTQRIVDAEGAVPVDFRADPRVEARVEPDAAPLDLAREFTVGQEFLLGWTYRAYRALGGEGGLLRFCLVAMGICASSILVGAWLLAREWTGSDRWGLFAAALLGLLPANYRTIGFVLMREDLSLPLFALHLGLGARALRTGGAGSTVAAALALGAALASWHAAGFFCAIEVAALVVVCAWRGLRDVAPRQAWLFVGVLFLVTLCVPVLRAKGAWASPALLGFVALAATTSLRARAGSAAWSARGERTALAGALAAAALLGWGAARSGLSGTRDYGHVLEFVMAKLIYLGQLPFDPKAISFDTRLLWQGPFATLPVDFGAIATWCVLVFWSVGVLGLARAESTRRATLLLAVLGGLSLVAGVLVQRVIVLPAIVGSVLAAGLLARLPRARALAAALVLGQGLFFVQHVRAHEIGWLRPLGLVEELDALVDWSRRELPPDAVLLGDFVTSPALLAHTGRAIALQPKYEAGESRARAREFLDVFFHGTPADLRTLARSRFGATHLVVDRYTLGTLSSYVAGLAPGRRPAAGTPAALFCNLEVSLPESVAGLHLVYRSPETIRQSNGRPFDLYRVYRIDP